MRIEEVLEILDKIEFFQGQRAGRELWANKPRAVQDEDIENFCRDVGIIREVLQRQRWIPVSERLPEEGENVFVAYIARYEENLYGDIAFREDDKWIWLADGTEPIVEITHWMPLPELPKEGTKNANRL